MDRAAAEWPAQWQGVHHESIDVSFAAGERTITLDPGGLHSGIYFTRLSTGSGHTATIRWVAVR
jgi:hypothetical protein